MADDPKPDALNTAADFIRVSTSLAVGALVFGVGYYSNVSTLTVSMRIGLVVATVAFVVSAAMGILAYSRVPVMIAACNYNIRDRLLSWLGATHQLTLGVGGVAFAFVLCSVIANEPPARALLIPSADVAVRKAQRSLAKTSQIVSVQVVELLRSVDANDLSHAVWHVRFELRASKGAPASEDVFVNAENGTVVREP